MGIRRGPRVHANGVNPQTGKLAGSSPGSSVQQAPAAASPGDNSTAYPMDSYSDSSISYAG